MNDLIKNIDRLHTTERGAERIKKNLSIEVDDVVAWCRNIITDVETAMEKRGKNLYAHTESCVITVNSHSYTIITAHKR